jgi:hypothetical protein
MRWPAREARVATVANAALLVPSALPLQLICACGLPAQLRTMVLLS